MRYEYECPLCGRFTNGTRDNTSRCPQCGFVARRVWSFTVAAPFQPHFNPSTNSFVSNRRDFNNQLLVANDQANERGIPQDVVPVDLRDKEALGVTAEGLDSTYDAMVKQGDHDGAKRLKKLIDE